MGDSLKSLAVLPDGVEQSAALIAQLDACFVVGFSRLGEAQLQALAALVRITSGSPLASAVGEAVQAIERAEFLDKHFAALACARAALQGAMHDALLAQSCAVLERSAQLPSEELLSPTIPPTPPHHTVFLESARKFLTRIALAGFSQLEMDPMVQFYLTLDKIQSEPGLIRQAAVLSGFLGELLAAMPIDAKATLPIYRWVDLWTRCMLLAVKPPVPARSQGVSGELKLLGCDLHHHPSLISACAYGLLFRSGSAPQLVRVTVSAYKVDLVQGAEMWRMFDGVADRLTGALRNRLTLKIDGMTLLASGDLIWDEARASHGPSFAPLDLAMAHAAPGKELARPAALAAERHPVLLAEPVALTGYAVKKIGDAAKGKKNPTAAELIDDLGIEVGGAVLPLTGTRLSAASGLTAEHIEKSQQLLGLLRFDRGRWALQPLAVAGGKSVELSGTPAASIKSKDDTVSILKERASKLLRKKS